MLKIKDEKGITLVTLALTIIVLSMISIPIAINANNIFKVNSLSQYKDDLTILNESISQIYPQTEDISEIGPVYTGDLVQIKKNPNDNNVYYIIDMDKLHREIIKKTGTDIVYLNHGEANYGIKPGNTEFSDDIYIINEQSRTIYYVKGYENTDGQTLYSYPGNYTNIVLQSYISE